jgi:hypothetical protein
MTGLNKLSRISLSRSHVSRMQCIQIGNFFLFLKHN